MPLKNEEIDFKHLALHDRLEAINRLGHTAHERRAYECHYFLCQVAPEVKTYEDAVSLITWVQKVARQLELRMNYQFRPVQAIHAWATLIHSSGVFTCIEDAQEWGAVTADTHFRRPKIPAANVNAAEMSGDDKAEWLAHYRTFIMSFPIDYKTKTSRYFTTRAYMVDHERIFTFNTDERLSEKGKERQQRLREYLITHGEFME